MQLRIIGFFIWLAPQIALSQQSSSWFKNNSFTETEINFLNSYYTQDGNHSPVTGGIGTERLTDITPTIIITQPIDSSRAIIINAGADFYTSASTDNIDARTGESGSDTRGHIDVTVLQHIPSKKATIGVKGGFSAEYDMTSFNLGMTWQQELRNENQSWGVNASFYNDNWLIFTPIELRSQLQLNENVRKTFLTSIQFSQVINRRTQALINAGITIQQGLLSTPFHRVFFDDGVDVSLLTEREIISSRKTRDIERLPTSRIKFPIGIRLNHYLNDWVVLRSNYRYYWDNFGIIGHTLTLDTPVKISPFLSVIPSLRLHKQTSSKYFKPFGQHNPSDTFYTSDFDLSDITSSQLGVAIRYAPLRGVFNLPLPKRNLTLEGIDAKYSLYSRDDGLKASIVSLNITMKVKK